MIKIFLATLYISIAFFFVIGALLFVAAVVIKFFGNYK